VEGAALAAALAEGDRAKADLTASTARCSNSAACLARSSIMLRPSVLLGVLEAALPISASSCSNRWVRALASGRRLMMPSTSLRFLP